METYEECRAREAKGMIERAEKIRKDDEGMGTRGCNDGLE